MNDKEFSGKKYFKLGDEQRLSWLRLIRSQNIGPVTFRDLISHYGSAEKALEAIPDLAKRGGAAARIVVCTRKDAERELILADRIGARFIGMGEPEYPENLRSCDASPPLLCIRGSPQALKENAVAVVGSRNASIVGMKVTETISRQIGEAGYSIISGLARGIDTIAHKAAIRTGTVAVFAGGVDVIFPHENKDLAEQILDQNGAIVSEMPMGWQPRARDFPRRNRIIAGLAKAVLVVEAARKSGSLITARLANEIGRIVMAIPGSPLDPRSEGTNNLIRDGASLITCAEDILEEITPMDKNAAGKPEVDEAELEMFEFHGATAADIREFIVQSLGPSPVSIDDIIQFTGASPGEIQLTLLELTLAGRVERHPGGLVSLISPEDDPGSYH